jgi:protein ImuA
MARSPLPEALRQSLAGLVRKTVPAAGLVALGVPALDAALGGGIGRGALHEMQSEWTADVAALTGFAIGVALRAAAGQPILWVRQDFAEVEAGGVHPPGLAEFGLDPGRLLLVRARDATQLLRAGGEAVRCSALGAVLLQPWGEPGVLDLTATRRLSLAAEGSGVPALLLRAPARPAPSAAATRWAVRALPSQALEAGAPGRPPPRSGCCAIAAASPSRNGRWSGTVTEAAWPRLPRGTAALLALWLPFLATDRRRRRRDCAVPAEVPFAVVETVRNALRLAAVDRRAAGRGLAAGLTLADARARVPDLAVADADPAADRRFLEDLAGLCDRWTPLVALDPPEGARPDGLMLDVTGCAHLFGGEAALRDGATARLAGSASPCGRPSPARRKQPVRSPGSGGRRWPLPAATPPRPAACRSPPWRGRRRFAPPSPAPA